MASVKIPYTYTNYPFSPKATKYSKKLSKGKMSAAVFVSMIMILVIFLIEFQLIDPSNTGDFLTVVVLVLPFVLGIACGIYAEKLRTRLYTKLIEKAIEKDLQKLAKTQPEQVAAYRLQLAKSKEKARK